jgi:hypothetical protein
LLLLSALSTCITEAKTQQIAQGRDSSDDDTSANSTNYVTFIKRTTKKTAFFLRVKLSIIGSTALMAKSARQNSFIAGIKLSSFK